MNINITIYIQFDQFDVELKVNTTVFITRSWPANTFKTANTNVRRRRPKSPYKVVAGASRAPYSPYTKSRSPRSRYRSTLNSISLSGTSRSTWRATMPRMHFTRKRLWTNKSSSIPTAVWTMKACWTRWRVQTRPRQTR